MWGPRTGNGLMRKLVCVCAVCPFELSQLKVEVNAGDDLMRTAIYIVYFRVLSGRCSSGRKTIYLTDRFHSLPSISSWDASCVLTATRKSKWGTSMMNHKVVHRSLFVSPTKKRIQKISHSGSDCVVQQKPRRWQKQTNSSQKTKVQSLWF